MSKEITEPTGPLGEISQGPSAFDAFLDRNQKGIAALAILLVIGAAALVVQRGISKSNERNAGAALNRAEDAASLQSLIKEFPDTAAEGSAMLLLADRQWQDGQQDAAITTLRDFLAKDGKHPASHTARASLGAKLLAQGKADEAARVFEDLAGDPTAGFIAPYALIGLGDIAKADGKPDDAETFYQRVRTDFPDSPFTDGASRRINLLKATAPAEIDPPPAPEPSEEPSFDPGPIPVPAPSIPEAPAPVTEEVPEESAPAEPAQPEDTQPEEVPAEPEPSPSTPEIQPDSPPSEQPEG